MIRFLWLVGLAVSICAVAALLVVPSEVALVPAMVGLVFGLAVTVLGVFCQHRQQKLEIESAMKSFAKANAFSLTELSVESLPASISLFQRGESRRCENTVAATVKGHKGFLFVFRYYVSLGSDGGGAWYERVVAFFPGLGNKPIPKTSKYHRSLCCEFQQGNLAVWHDRNWIELWRTGIPRSFQPVHQWMTEDLEEILETVSQLLSEKRSTDSALGRP